MVNTSTAPSLEGIDMLALVWPVVGISTDRHIPYRRALFGRPRDEFGKHRRFADVGILGAGEQRQIVPFSQFS